MIRRKHFLQFLKKFKKVGQNCQKAVYLFVWFLKDEYYLISQVRIYQKEMVQRIVNSK